MGLSLDISFESLLSSLIFNSIWLKWLSKCLNHALQVASVTLATLLIFRSATTGYQKPGRNQEARRPTSPADTKLVAGPAPAPPGRRAHRAQLGLYCTSREPRDDSIITAFSPAALPLARPSKKLPCSPLERHAHVYSPAPWWAAALRRGRASAVRTLLYRNVLRHTQSVRAAQLGTGYPPERSASHLGNGGAALGVRMPGRLASACAI